MKKLFLIIAATFMATTAWAQSQQLITVKGKTKDGKSINVQYYKGTVQDYIESVKYQLVDELKAENKNKQNTINDMQSQLNSANRKIENLNKQLKESGKPGVDPELEQQLAQKQSEIEQLNQQLNELNAQLSASRAENVKLNRQLDSIKAVNLRLSQNKTRLDKNPVIGVEGSMGSIFLSNNSLNNPWGKALSWNKQVAVYFGTSRLAEGFPVSIEAGVGFRSLPMSAKLSHYELDFTQDLDGDQYQPIFENCSEKLTVNCLEVPVRLCIGQPGKKVSVYTKLGVTPSFILSAKLAESAYTRKGYYPEWNVTLEDIEELDFFNEGGESKIKVTPAKRFNLWGNAAFGVYVPLTSSMLFNVGVKLDYPILKTGTFTTTEKDMLLPPNGLMTYNGRMLVTSLQAGLVYTLK